MIKLRKILAVLFMSAFILSITPQPSHSFGIPSIDIQSLVQAVKRAMTDVQNSQQLAWATKAAKSVQGALGKFNEAMNGFIKKNILDRLDKLKEAKEKYEEKVKKLKDNKWVKKATEIADKVKEGKELADRANKLINEGKALKAEADQLISDAQSSVEEGKRLVSEAGNIKKEAETMISDAKKYATEGPKLLKEGTSLLKSAEDLIAQSKEVAQTKSPEEGEKLYQEALKKKVDVNLLDKL